METPVERLRALMAPFHSASSLVNADGVEWVTTCTASAPRSVVFAVALKTPTNAPYTVGYTGPLVAHIKCSHLADALGITAKDGIVISGIRIRGTTGVMSHGRIGTVFKVTDTSRKPLLPSRRVHTVVNDALCSGDFFLPLATNVDSTTIDVMATNPSIKTGEFAGVSPDAVSFTGQNPYDRTYIFSPLVRHRDPGWYAVNPLLRYIALNAPADISPSAIIFENNPPDYSFHTEITNPTRVVIDEHTFQLYRTALLGRMSAQPEVLATEVATTTLAFEFVGNEGHPPSYPDRTLFGVANTLPTSINVFIEMDICACVARVTQYMPEYTASDEQTRYM
jgi:hypothetical protein